jgi:hypothetical protein
MKSLSILLLLASSLYEVSAIERTAPFLAFSPQKYCTRTFFVFGMLKQPCPENEFARQYSVSHSLTHSSRFTAGNELDSAVISVQDLKAGVLDMVDCHKAILVVDEPEVREQHTCALERTA